MNWPTAPLGDLCEMDRQGLQSDESDAKSLPFVGVENVESGSGVIDFGNDTRVGSQKSTSFRFDERHVLYGKLRPYLNKVATPAFAGKCSTELVPLLPRAGVDREFLGYLLRRKETVEYAMSSVTGARMPRTDMRALMSLSVPLPPPDEQMRIVGILNRASKIEQLRKQARERLREMVPALFVKMFGDPVENPMRWKIRRFCELVEEFRYGTSKKCSAEASDGRLPILRIPNVIRNVIDWNGVKFAALDEREANAIRLKDGDILLVRTNGNAEYIGRCAVFHGNRPTAYASYLIRARPRSGGFPIPEYIAGVLDNAMMRRVLLSLARTTAGNYNINIASLSSLPIPVPPIDRQRLYTQLVEKIRSSIAVTESGYSATSSLSTALMSRLLGAST